MYINIYLDKYIYMYYEAELVTFNAEHGDTFAQKKAKEKKWVYTYTNIYYIGILIYI